MDLAVQSNDDLVRAIKAPYRPVLVVIMGLDLGQRRRLDRSLTIGRNPESGFALTDPSVSWNHARIEDRGDSWAVVDLGSTNGTFVNGTRVNEAILSPGDKLALSRTVVRFELQDAIEQSFDETVERMLNIDDLSGLYLRRRFDAELKTMLEAARTTSTPVGLLVMDLDGVKQINDTHGHLFGAYVIGEAGKVIGDTLGSRGIGSRFGGDEYSAALPGADLTQASAVAHEILQAINQHPFSYENVALHPGISIGVASFPESAQDQQDLFRRADEALYRAKQGGKNRVCL